MKNAKWALASGLQLLGSECRHGRWTVAAVGLAVGGGLYLAASTSTVIILIILAGIKPLEEAYRSRNQSCQLKIEVDSGSLTPELLKEALGLRNGQIKRFLVENRNQQGTDDLSVLLSKVSSHDIATYPDKLKELDGVRVVTVVRRPKDQPAKPTRFAGGNEADVRQNRFLRFWPIKSGLVGAAADHHRGSPAQSQALGRALLRAGDLQHPE